VACLGRDGEGAQIQNLLGIGIRLRASVVSIILSHGNFCNNRAVDFEKKEGKPPTFWQKRNNQWLNLASQLLVVIEFET